MSSKKSDKIKTFKDLSSILSVVAKQSEENNRNKTTSTKRRQRNKDEGAVKVRGSNKAAKATPAPVEEVPMSKEDSDKLASMSKTGAYPDVAELAMADKIDEALAGIEAHLEREPDSLQLLTAKNLLINCQRSGVSKSTRSHLLVNVKHVLMNTENGDKLLSDITSFNEYENADQIEASNRNREFNVVCGSIAQCLDHRDLREVALSLAEILEQKLTQECRNIFKVMFRKLKTFLEEEAEYIDPLPEPRYADMIGFLRGKLSDAMMESLTWDEREEKSIEESRVEVTLPLDVSKVTIVEDIPMLIDIEGFMDQRVLDAFNLKRLANTTYLGRVRVIGVPTGVNSRENNYEAEFHRAKQFIWRREKILLQNMPMRRPDSDATWFPIIPIEGVINNVAFPDRVRSSINDQVSIEERRRMQMTNTIQIRARRQAFEAVEKPLVNFIDTASMRVKELRLLVKEHGEILKEKFGVTTPDPMLIKVHYRNQVEEEVRGEVSLPVRLRTRIRINRERDRFLKLAHDKIDYQAESRVLNRQLKESVVKLEAKRRAVLNPNKERSRINAEALMAL